MSANRSFPWPRLAYSRRRLDALSGAAADDAPDRFRRLVLPHLDAAYSYARYLARDGAAAEDIVQEAFLRAWKGFSNCRGSEKSWLLAIVRNCFRDWASASQRGDGRADPLDDIHELTDEAEPEGILLHRMDMEIVRETITRLPEPFRETLVLRELEELSYREIATLTATPIGTVMSRLARGREMLARLLIDHQRGAVG